MSKPFVALEFPPWINWGQRRGASVHHGLLRDSYPDHKIWTHRRDGTMGYVGDVRRCGWCAEPCTGRRTAWCSDTCSEKFYRVWSWGAVSNYVAERDGRKCVRCETSRAAFECDHIVPVKDGGTDDPANLRTLCHDCHIVAGIEQRRVRRLKVAPELAL